MNGSSSNAAIPVIAGLTVGIGLIVLFSISLRPSSDEEIRAKVRNLPEVQALYERYAPLEQITHDGTSTYVDYSIERAWYREHGDAASVVIDHFKVLTLIVKVDSFGRTSMTLGCGGPMSTGLPASVEEIRTTPCLESP